MSTTRDQLWDHNSDMDFCGQLIKHGNPSKWSINNDMSLKPDLMKSYSEISLLSWIQNHVVNYKFNGVERITYVELYQLLAILRPEEKK